MSLKKSLELYNIYKEFFKNLDLSYDVFYGLMCKIPENFNDLIDIITAANIYRLNTQKINKSGADEIYDLFSERIFEMFEMVNSVFNKIETEVYNENINERIALFAGNWGLQKLW